jgi:hypothetical protein
MLGRVRGRPRKTAPRSAGSSRRCASCAGERLPQVAFGFHRGGARPPTEVIVRYVDAYRERHGVEPICRTLTGAGCKIVPSTY